MQYILQLQKEIYCLLQKTPQITSLYIISLVITLHYFQLISNIVIDQSQNVKENFSMIGMHAYLKLGILNRPILWNNDEQNIIYIVTLNLLVHIYFYYVIMKLNFRQIQQQQINNLNMEYYKNIINYSKTVNLKIISYFVQLYQWIFFMPLMDINLHVLFMDLQSNKEIIQCLAIISLIIQILLMLLTIFTYSNDNFYDTQHKLSRNFKTGFFIIKLLQFLIILIQNKNFFNNVNNNIVFQMGIVLIICFYFLKILLHGTIHNNIMISAIHIIILFVFVGTQINYSCRIFLDFCKDEEFPLVLYIFQCLILGIYAYFLIHQIYLKRFNKCQFSLSDSLFEVYLQLRQLLQDSIVQLLSKDDIDQREPQEKVFSQYISLKKHKQFCNRPECQCINLDILSVEYQLKSKQEKSCRKLIKEQYIQISDFIQNFFDTKLQSISSKQIDYDYENYLIKFYDFILSHRKNSNICLFKIQMNNYQNSKQSNRLKFVIEIIKANCTDIKLKKKKNKNQIIINQNNTNIELIYDNFFISESKKQQLKKEIISLSGEIKQFWEKTIIRYKNIDVLYDRILILVQKINIIKDKFQSYSEIYTTNPSFLKLYILFSLIIDNNLFQAQQIERQIDQNFKNNINVNFQEIFNDFINFNICSIVASFLESQGIVKVFTDQTPQFFGYLIEEFKILKKIDKLMPPIIAQNHHSYIQRYLQAGKYASQNAPRLILGINKNGYCFSIQLQIQNFYGFSNDFCLLSTLIKNKKSSDNILCFSDEYGIILGCSQHFAEICFKNSSKTQLQSINKMQLLQKMNIRFFIPQYFEIVSNTYKQNEKKIYVQLERRIDNIIMNIPYNLQNLMQNFLTYLKSNEVKSQMTSMKTDQKQKENNQLKFKLQSLGFGIRQLISTAVKNSSQILLKYYAKGSIFQKQIMLDHMKINKQIFYIITIDELQQINYKALFYNKKPLSKKSLIRLKQGSYNHESDDEDDELEISSNQLQSNDSSRIIEEKLTYTINNQLTKQIDSIKLDFIGQFLDQFSIGNKVQRLYFFFAFALLSFFSFLTAYCIFMVDFFEHFNLLLNQFLICSKLSYPIFQFYQLIYYQIGLNCLELNINPDLLNYLNNQYDFLYNTYRQFIFNYVSNDLTMEIQQQSMEQFKDIQSINFGQQTQQKMSILQFFNFQINNLYNFKQHNKDINYFDHKQIFFNLQNFQIQYDSYESLFQNIISDFNQQNVNIKSLNLLCCILAIIIIGISLILMFPSYDRYQNLIETIIKMIAKTTGININIIEREAEIQICLINYLLYQLNNPIEDYLLYEYQENDWQFSLDQFQTRQNRQLKKVEKIILVEMKNKKAFENNKRKQTKNLNSKIKEQHLVSKKFMLVLLFIFAICLLFYIGMYFYIDSIYNPAFQLILSIKQLAFASNQLQLTLYLQSLLISLNSIPNPQLFTSDQKKYFQDMQNNLTESSQNYFMNDFQFNFLDEKIIKNLRTQFQNYNSLNICQGNILNIDRFSIEQCEQLQNGIFKKGYFQVIQQVILKIIQNLETLDRNNKTQLLQFLNSTNYTEQLQINQIGIIYKLKAGEISFQIQTQFLLSVQEYNQKQQVEMYVILSTQIIFLISLLTLVTFKFIFTLKKELSLVLQSIRFIPHFKMNQDKGFKTNICNILN